MYVSETWICVHATRLRTCKADQNPMKSFLGQSVIMECKFAAAAWAASELASTTVEAGLHLIPPLQLVVLKTMGCKPTCLVQI